MTTQPPTILRLDPRALKVLAHPLRSRLLTALRVHGPATATALADDARDEHGRDELPPAQARLGRPRRGDRRRSRPRTAVAGRHRDARLDRARRRRRPGRRAATDWLRRYYLRGFVERYERWLDEQAGVAARLAGRGRRERLRAPALACRAGRVQRRDRGAGRALSRPRRAGDRRRRADRRPGPPPRLPARRGRRR